jgi:hypothetical protein
MGRKEDEGTYQEIFSFFIMRWRRDRTNHPERYESNSQPHEESDLEQLDPSGCSMIAEEIHDKPREEGYEADKEG